MYSSKKEVHVSNQRAVAAGMLGVCLVHPSLLPIQSVRLVVGHVLVETQLESYKVVTSAILTKNLAHLCDEPRPGEFVSIWLSLVDCCKANVEIGWKRRGGSCFSPIAVSLRGLDEDYLGLALKYFAASDHGLDVFYLHCLAVGADDDIFVATGEDTADKWIILDFIIRLVITILKERVEISEDVSDFSFREVITDNWTVPEVQEGLLEVELISRSANSLLVVRIREVLVIDDEGYPMSRRCHRVIPKIMLLNVQVSWNDSSDTVIIV